MGDADCSFQHPGFTQSHASQNVDSCSRSVRLVRPSIFMRKIPPNPIVPLPGSRVLGVEQHSVVLLLLLLISDVACLISARCSLCICSSYGFDARSHHVWQAMSSFTFTGEESIENPLPVSKIILSPSKRMHVAFARRRGSCGRLPFFFYPARYPGLLLHREVHSRMLRAINMIFSTSQ